MGRNANFILIFFTSPHKKDCRKFFASQKLKQDAKTSKNKESDGLFVIYIYTSRKEAGSVWCKMSYMCNDDSKFIKLKRLETIQDGTAERTVQL